MCSERQKKPDSGAVLKSSGSSIQQSFQPKQNFSVLCASDFLSVQRK